jgi:transcriptional regulator with XRE-family HTH domain
MKKKAPCVAFGSIVRRFREAAGLSQEGLAAKAGIHRTYIGGIERGERNPTLLMIHRLAKALGIIPGQLFR